MPQPLTQSSCAHASIKHPKSSGFAQSHAKSSKSARSASLGIPLAGNPVTKHPSPESAWVVSRSSAHAPRQGQMRRQGQLTQADSRLGCWVTGLPNPDTCRELVETCRKLASTGCLLKHLHALSVACVDPCLTPRLKHLHAAASGPADPGRLETRVLGYWVTQGYVDACNAPCM